MKILRGKWLFGLGFLAVLAAGVWFRGAGLWHGLEQGITYHPDEPKQVMKLEEYLRGHYVHHMGNRFYDGYPYGLNRVDEACLRIWTRASAAARSWVAGVGNVPAALPEHADVYRAGRVLRLLYGMLAALLVFASARRWGAGRWAALAGAALYAASPLAVTVAHSVTGDVGVDLFVAVALYAASAHAVGGRAGWWLVFGAACGAGWACKFQGALAAWMAVPPLLLGLRDGWRGWKRLCAGVLLAAAGFVGAAALLNPALVLDTTRAWRDTWANFGFIQDYGVPPERLAWPFGKKLVWGISNNVPFVARCLGWGLVAAGLAASAVLAAVSWRTAAGRGADAKPSGPADPTEPAPTPAEAREEAERAARASRWLLGIATFPWLAFLLATALKLEIQPFHFTFLVPPLALVVSLAVSWWTEPPDGEPRRMAAVAAAVVLAAVLAGEVCGTMKEIFFWWRPDIRNVARLQAEALFGDDGWGADRRGTSRWIKRFYAEPAVLPCFRNAESRLNCPAKAWRKEQLLLPVPAVPMPASCGDCWIFMDGPVFPRNDRMFVVPATGNGFPATECAADGTALFAETRSPAGAWTERVLVFPEAPRSLHLGLRTGKLPVRCEVATSLLGSTMPRMLAPESQTVVELPRPDPVYAHSGDESGNRPAVWACRLRIRAQLGPVWVTVLGSPAEAALYGMHGPDSVPGAHPVSADLPLFAGELEGIRYLDSGDPLVLPVIGETPLPPAVPGAGPGLAAGAYRFRARVDAPEATAITLLLADRKENDAPDTLPSTQIPVPGGESEIDWAFAKPYAPYGATLRAGADTGGVRILSWTLKPDVEALAAWSEAPRAQTEPLLPGGIEPGGIPWTELDVAYPKIGTILGIRIPDSWHVSDTIAYEVSFRLHPDIAHKRFQQLAVFLHLEKEDGKLAGTLDYNIDDVSFEGGPVRWKLKSTPDLPPGTYKLTAGLFNARNGKKFYFVPHKRIFDVKHVTVLPD